MIGFDLLNSYFSYDPDTGLLFWKIRRPGVRRDKPAGTINEGGYIQIHVDGKIYLAHRIIWVLMTGEWPKEDIDHRDTYQLNNRWENLREATDTQNAGNCRARARNTSGYKGVSFDRKRGKFTAQIGFKGRIYYLGSFDDPKVAHERYVAKANELFGEFARAS